MSATIRTAIIGFGVSGKVFHAPLLAANPDFEISFIATANSERQQQAADAYPHASIVPSYREVLASAEELDLLVIGTPPPTHFEIARAALKRGLNVVIDKPFVVHSAQGEELIALAAELGLTLTVYQNRRWDGDFLTIKKLLGEEALGAVHTFESRFEWFKPQGMRSWKAELTAQQGGGILFDLGTHLIDQAIELFGPVNSVQASLRPLTDQATAEEDAHVLLRHCSGTESRLTMSSLNAAPGARFQMAGHRGAYTSFGLDPQEPQLASGMSPTQAEYGQKPEAHWGQLATGQATREVPTLPGDYPQFYRALASCLRHAGPVPVDPHDSLAVLRLIESIHRDTVTA
ncbi:Gfo/Idh/MocA family oxidoreductase [Glutamicibacter endophyticus]|uniref:Gfo/Idh/MocA family oxidoreductase n=1 Tax=Glutamicibacter endophyticus TaxID=1522174 RepID=UPI003AEFC9C9